MSAAFDQAGARYLCPNCEQRMPDTSTAYDEVLMRSATSRSVGRGRHTIRSRSISTHGNVWLCGQCSAAYKRMVALRERGHRLLRWGAIGLLVGGVILALLYAAFQGEDVGVALISLPTIASVLVILLAAAMLTLARIRRPGVTRFLNSPNLAHMAAPPERLSLDTSASTLTAPVQRLTAEDRRRERRRGRLRWLGIAGGGVALVVVLLTALSLGLQHQRALVPPYSADLTVAQGGWSDDGDVCTFATDGYHLTPKAAGKGISCFAPAGDFADFDAQATARLVSGPASTDYGLDFRLGDDLTVGDGYIFEVTADGRAWIALLRNGAISRLSPIWQFPAGVSTGTNDSHTLKVEARGSTLTCFVDGKQVGSYSDSHFTAGRLGLFAGQAGADVVFTAFSVTPE
jgi:hypothetical protein